MLRVVLLWLVASMVPALCQRYGSGIESVRVGMSQEAVEASLKGQDVMKATSPQDRSQETWSFTDAAGTNTITFQNGKTVAVDSHVSAYHGDGRDLVKKLYSLLYLMTKAMPSDERTATAIVALQEYPSVTGDEPIRHIELRFGDRHIDLTTIGAESLGVADVALLGQGSGHAPSRTK